MNVYEYKKNLNLHSFDVYVNEKKKFRASFENVFDDGYSNPMTLEYNSDYYRATLKRWYLHSIDGFWQNQLNFAVWCATTGCGVTLDAGNDHLSRSFFKFHVYYQTRRVLQELAAPLPSDPSFDRYANNTDKGAYRRLCREFGVPIETDWKIKGNIFGNYEEKWSTFVNDRSKGFTTPGLRRLDASIRIFVWAILGAQGETRTSIASGTSTSLDAQKQFLANVEDAVNRPLDLPADISRYEDCLKYANSKLDYVVHPGLYMLPSDMALKIGENIVGYNNEIVIAPVAASIGTNVDLNAKTFAKIRPPQVESPPHELNRHHP